MRQTFRRWAERGLFNFAVIAVCSVTSLANRAYGQAEMAAPGPRMPQAPPSNPPSIDLSLSARIDAPRVSATQVYSIGDPTDEEQLYLEYINFTRANPTVEAQILATTADPDVLTAFRFFSVDLNLMQQQFSSLTPVQPLSLNPELTAAARLHSGDMFTNDFQSHSGTDGSDPFSRMMAQGYHYISAAENIYSYAASVFDGEAGFEVDWGPGPGGMQSPPGHRINTHNGVFREIGVGVLDGLNQVSSNTPVGPQIVTQDFGTTQPNTPFLTGVVYYDFNANGAYDVGEGIGGVSVMVDGVNEQGVSARSGGYSVPLPGNGSYTVTFFGPSLSNRVTALVSGNNNLKVDFAPAYVAPTVHGPANLFLNSPTAYSFTSVGGAQSYQLQQSIVVPYTTVEGAEHGLASVTAQTTGGYSVIQSGTVHSGSFAFQLAHAGAPFVSQILALNPQITVSSSSMLTFYTHFGFATTNEVAEAQVSANDGVTWQTVWSQAGTQGAGAVGFAKQTVSLSAFAGEAVQVRFVYAVNGSAYTSPLSSVGFFLDDIAISPAQVAQIVALTDISSASSFMLTAVSNATYALQIRALLPGRTLPFGPALNVVAAGGAPSARITGITLPTSGKVQINFTPPPSGTFGYQLFMSSALGNTWTADPAAVRTNLSSTVYQFNTTVPLSDPARFYKIGISP